MTRLKFFAVSALGGLASILGIKPKQKSDITLEQLQLSLKRNALAKRWLEENGFDITTQEWDDRRVGTVTHSTIPAFHAAWSKEIHWEHYPWFGALRSLDANGWKLSQTDWQVSSEETISDWNDVKTYGRIRVLAFQKPDWYDQFARSA